MFRIDRSFINEGTDKVLIKPPATLDMPCAEEEKPDAAPDIPAPQPAEADKKQEEEARKAAQAIIDDAQKQADILLDEASEQAQSVREQAFNEGFQDGQAKAEREAAKAQQKTDAAVQKTLDAIAQSRDNFLRSMEKDILNLAVDIARKIVHTEINTKDESFLMLVQNALNHMKSESEITIRMSAEDYTWFGEAAERFLKPGHSTAKIHVLEDPLLLKGSVVLESSGESINAGIETQLSSARIALMEEADIQE